MEGCKYGRRLTLRVLSLRTEWLRKSLCNMVSAPCSLTSSLIGPMADSSLLGMVGDVQGIVGKFR